MIRNSLLAALLCFALSAPVDAQPAPEFEAAGQIRAASRWPHAAQEARDAGVPAAGVSELFEIVRERDYSSRDVRRLLLTIASQASAWGTDVVVERACEWLAAGATPADVRGRITAGPAEGDGWAPRTGRGRGDSTGRVPDGQDPETWQPGSRGGEGSGTGLHVPGTRDWPTRSGEGPRDRSGISADGHPRRGGSQ